MSAPAYSTQFDRAALVAVLVRETLALTAVPDVRVGVEHIGSWHVLVGFRGYGRLGPRPLDPCAVPHWLAEWDRLQARTLDAAAAALEADGFAFERRRSGRHGYLRVTAAPASALVGDDAS